MMESINIETEKFKACGEEVKTFANEANTLFDSLFNRIEGVPTKTGEWMGKSAEKFVEYAALEHAEYNDFVGKLHDFGQLMVDYSVELGVAKSKTTIKENSNGAN